MATTRQTIEIKCAVCGELRWPTLPDRPVSYTCVRCRAIPAAQRTARREAGRRRADAQKARRGASQTTEEELDGPSGTAGEPTR
jgi:hypothetical protein